MSEIAELEAAVAALEAQRGVLGDGVVDAAVGPMREKLAGLVEAEATPGVPADDGERKFVTMIFADLSGSTALGEVMDPEEIRDLLNGCFDRLVPAVKGFGGTIDKFIGDNVMALFGAPVAHENDPERALRACLGMMEALEGFNADMGVGLGIHVGVNSGLVIAGGVGSEGERRYSVLGDAVNVAARLEGASERGEILVGPDTRRLAGPLFDYVDLEPILVKGRDEPVAVSRLVGVRAGRESGRGIAGLSSPMVGRDAETVRFAAKLDGLAEGQGGIVSIVADAGVGKSRFIVEAKAASPGLVRWREGAALAYSADTPYALANDLMRDLLEVAPDAALEDVSGALAATLALGMPAEQARQEWPFLARLLDLPLGDEAESVIAQYADSPETLVQRTEDAFTRLVTAAVSAPLVVVWEDLHWADQSSLKLLEGLIPRTGELALLLVLIFRPGDSPVSGLHERLTAGNPGYEVVELATLSRNDSELLVDGLLNVENLPAATKELILAKAEGNPLFLEELLRALIDAEMVVIEAGKALATDNIHDLKAIDIPDTVHGVISARIDRLPPDRKATLQAASVIGRVFQRRVLEHLSPRSTDTDLAELQRLDFIFSGDTSETARLAEYMFKHAFTQEAAYNGLLLARRRALHQTAAEAIEALFPERTDELSPILARHYEAAEMQEKATDFLLQAAERAAAAYANDEALGFIVRGLELTGHDDGRARSEFLLVRERVLDVTGQRDLQLADLDALAATADSLTDHTLLLETTLRRAELLIELGEYEPSIEIARNALELAGTLDDAPGAARAHLVAGSVLARVSRLTEAEDELRLGLDIAEKHGLLEQQMRLLQRIALVAFGRKGHAECRLLLETALELALRLGNRRAQGPLHQNLGIMSLALCELDYCREHFNRALALAKEMGDIALEAGSLASLGEVDRLDGRFEDALDNSQRALDISEHIESGFWIATQHRAVADALVGLGRADEAVEEAKQAVDQWRELGSTPHLMDCLASLARATVEADDPAGARAVAEEAVQYLLDGGDVTGAAYPFRVYATCLDILKATHDPRFGQLLAQATNLLYNLYPDGGCLPWMKDIRRHAATYE
jgi:class 3 adenylate cyclase/tetratricopeptide (TPR) repeat protein